MEYLEARTYEQLSTQFDELYVQIEELRARIAVYEPKKSGELVPPDALLTP
jgi:hypothetical protein